MLSEEERLEEDYKFNHGPFDERGWYETAPGMWSPGRPWVEIANSTPEDPKQKEFRENLRKQLRDIANEEI